MTDDLYERYKEALRTGHIAVLRGALEDAAEAYRAAASIAPSRALPHTSLGGVLLRQHHIEEALVEYASAAARAPHDEGALLGQAEALAIAGRRVEAAQTLDHVAEIREAGGRLPEAADTLRRALDLEETPERSRRQRALLREIRLSAGDQAAEQQLARALRLRDEPSDAAAGTVPASPTMTAEATLESQPGEPIDVPVAFAVAQWSEAGAPARIVVADSAGLVEYADTLAGEPGEGGGRHLSEPQAEEPLPSDRIAPALPESVLEPVGVTVGGRDAVLAGMSTVEARPQATADELLGAAEAAETAGDSITLRSLLLSAARAYALDGRFEAGLDVAHRLLQESPGDVDAHLVLVDLYLARDWNTLAADKLALLGRLAEIDNDDEARQRLCAVASRAFPNDERLQALCT